MDSRAAYRKVEFVFSLTVFDALVSVFLHQIVAGPESWCNVQTRIQTSKYAMKINGSRIFSYHANIKNKRPLKLTNGNEVMSVFLHQIVAGHESLKGRRFSSDSKEEFEVREYFCK